MPPRRFLSTLQRGQALGWLQDGISFREVGRRLGVSHSVIQRLLERFQATGRADNRPRSGRPRSTNRREDRMLCREALRDRTVTSSTLRAQLAQAANINVSSATIRRRLHEYGLASRRPVVRVPLTEGHRQARAAWCRRHVRWNRQQWSQVLFTDESRFALSFNDGRVRVWRRPGERYADNAVREVDRYGGGSVMVWGGFSRQDRTPLYVIRGSLTGQRYRDEIVRPLIQPALLGLGAGAVLQDDNARPHRARVVDDYLQQHGIARMEWPARSPDLAPIEHLWDELGRRVARNHPRPVNVAQLTQFLQQEWNAIPDRVLHVLVDSMRQRCRECLNANGAHTRY